MSFLNLYASLGDLRRKLRATRRESADRDAGFDVGRDDEEGAGKAPAASMAIQERARNLAVAAMAYAGTDVRRLDRAASRAYLPFDLE